jgi:ABC-type branched-subunit amino acid transport system substrate-binding protein
LIIGPFFEKPYTQVAEFSKSNKIQAICPVNQSNKLLFNNKYVTELNTSYPTQITYLASYLSRERNTENVLCISGRTKKDKYLADLFSADYKKAIAPFNNNYRNAASTFSFISYSSMKGFDSKLVKGKKNVIVIPITEEGLATSFFTQLNVMMSKSRMNGYEIEIYGLENFLEYDDIETAYKLRYNLHVTSPSFIDYNSQRVKDFVKNYRAEYGTEPNKYAFIGFDVAIYHGVAMTNFGKNFTPYYEQVKIPLLQSNYVLKRSDMNSGFENQSVFILKYEDYKLLKIN